MQAAKEAEGRVSDLQIVIPSGDRLGDQVIEVDHLTKGYGDRLLIEDLTFSLPKAGIVGIIGPNGAGKTTLFRMIVGEESPDEGDVSVPKKLSIGYFRQDVEEMAGRSVLDEAIAGSGRLGDLHHELMELEHAMGDPSRPDYDKVLNRFGHVQEEYQHNGGYELEAHRGTLESAERQARQSVRELAWVRELASYAQDRGRTSTSTGNSAPVTSFTRA